MDDFVEHAPPSSMLVQQRTVNNHNPAPRQPTSFEQSPPFHVTEEKDVEVMTDSSSSSSSSDSDSEHENPPPVNRPPVLPSSNTHRNNTNGYPNAIGSNSHNRNLNSNIFQDLELSEDDSD